jgi:hypothetical protein
VWLPLAYVRGDFGIEYVLLLFVAPVVGLALPAWFLYESTVANLTEPTDDRSTGLRRWYIVTTVVLIAAAGAGFFPVEKGKHIGVVLVIALVLFVLYALFCASVFMGEPLGTPRRVRNRWDRHNAGRFTRWLGPSMERAFLMQLIGLLVSFGVLTLVALVQNDASPIPMRQNRIDALLRFIPYVLAFSVFALGLGAWLRSRSNNLFGVRILFAVILSGLAIVPWIIAAIGGIAFQGSDTALSFASPSPFYAALLVDPSAKRDIIRGGLVMSCIWGGLGLLLFVSAFRRSAAIVRAWEQRLTEIDAVFAAEDAMATTMAPADEA